VRSGWWTSSPRLSWSCGGARRRAARRSLPWLLAVARNVWLNHERGERRYGAAVRRLPLPPPASPPEEPGDPEEVGVVSRVLAALDPVDQEIHASWPGKAMATIRFSDFGEVTLEPPPVDGGS
jgi:hypothetical protein